MAEARYEWHAKYTVLLFYEKKESVSKKYNTEHKSMRVLETKFQLQYRILGVGLQGTRYTIFSTQVYQPF